MGWAKAFRKGDFLKVPKYGLRPRLVLSLGFWLRQIRASGRSQIVLWRRLGVCFLESQGLETGCVLVVWADLNQLK